jgi:hypothetical protein
MSSRNTFTTNYIYHERAAIELANRIEHLGYGIKVNKGLADYFQVVGMIKDVEWSNSTFRYFHKLLREIKHSHGIEYELSIVFVGDTYPVITHITTGDPTDWDLNM